MRFLASKMEALAVLSKDSPEAQHYVTKDWATRVFWKIELEIHSK